MNEPLNPGQVSRRALLAAGGGAALLAACSGTTNSSGATGSTQVFNPPSSSNAATSGSSDGTAPTVDRTIRVLMPPQSILDAALETIAARLGVPVVVEAYADPAFVIERLLAQQGEYQYDVVVAPGAFLPAAISAGLLQPIDPTGVPALAGQLERVKASPFDPQSRYSICKEVGYTGYAWDKTVLIDGIGSWSEFLTAAQRPGVSGKVTCLAEGAELLAIPTWSEGRPTGAEFDPDAAATAIEERLQPHLLDLDSGATVRMLEGSVVLAQMWNGEGRQLVASDPDRWGYAIGAPVTGVWMERFVIPASAPNPDLATAFIDNMLQPDISLAQVEARGYNTGVADIQQTIAGLGGVPIPTDADMFGPSKDYGESLLTASAEELTSLVVGTVQALSGTSQTAPTVGTTVPAATGSPAVDTTSPTAASPETTTGVTPTTAQLDQKSRRVLRPFDEGPEVVDLQERLKALGFAVGQPDGQYGDLTLAAVLGFQRSQGLQTDGVVGAYTWDALEDSKPIVSRDANTRGVAANAPSDATGHASNTAPSGARTWVKAIVYLDSFRDEFFDANGTLVGSFPNSPGVNGLTPTGTFQVYSRSADTFYSRNPSETMKWMVRFNGGVGFHSIPQIDGVPQTTPLGQAPSSHGCIRHADDIAKKIFDNLADNAVVVVRHG